MDAEAIANAQGYRALVAMRDAAYERLEDEMKHVRAEVEALEAGNRRDRRRGASWREKMERRRRQWRTKIDEIFNRLARGFDPNLGTSTSVQADAAEAFAGIFGEEER